MHFHRSIYQDELALECPLSVEAVFRMAFGGFIEVFGAREAVPDAAQADQGLQERDTHTISQAHMFHFLYAGGS